MDSSPEAKRASERERDTLPTGTNPTSQRKLLTSVLLFPMVWINPPFWPQFIWVVEVLRKVTGGPGACS